MTEPRSTEVMLGAAASSWRYPATPDLAAAVLARLPDAAPTPVNRVAPRWRYAAVAMAVVVATTALALAASRDVRDAVADFLGLAVEGERITALPEPDAPATPLPSPPTLDSIVRPATLDEATDALGFEPRLLPGEPPERVFLADFVSQEALVLDYGRFALWQLAVAQGFIGKDFFQGSTTVEETRVDGVPAYWVVGGRRLVRFIGPDGKEVAGTARSVDVPALIWSGEGVYYRLEGDLTLADALALAESLE